jgi:phage-related tail fiber protein
MAQHDYNIANQTASSARTDINNALAAIVSNNSGTSAPSSTFANQWWYDTTNNKLYFRNEGNTAWIELGQLDQVNNKFFSSGTPSGAVMNFAQSTAPTGWLKANGQLISRATYASLFSAIGTTYGAGDGTTTFKVPDLRGEFVRGWDDSRGVDTGRSLGSLQSWAIQNITGVLTYISETWAQNGVATGPLQSKLGLVLLKLQVMLTVRLRVKLPLMQVRQYKRQLRLAHAT